MSEPQLTILYYSGIIFNAVFAAFWLLAQLPLFQLLAASCAMQICWFFGLMYPLAKLKELKSK